LDDVALGRGKPKMIEMLFELIDTMRSASDCPVGKTASDIVLFALNGYRDQFETHIREGACPSGICGEKAVYHTVCPNRSGAPV
jgi:NADH:ubiquinone oxidoreductase subunit F (NADH-binding)